MKGLRLLQTRLTLNEPTPLVNHDDMEPPEIVTKLLSDYLFNLGLSPIGYAEEKKGRIFHNVIPIPGKEDESSNQGSSELLPHTDGPHRETPPHWTALFCIRNEPFATTYTVDIDNLLSKLPEEVIESLMTKRFVHVPSTSWVGDKERVQSVLYQMDDGTLGIRANTRFCLGCTPKEQLALKILRETAMKNITGIFNLISGDILMIDNRRSLHGRSAFKSVADGRSRWLVRVYANER